MAATKNLIQKLSEISASVGRVPKNGYNNFHKYKYVLEADLVDHIRPLLAERNLFIVPRVTEHLWDGEMSQITYEYDIMDGDSGESITTSSVGYGSDKGDKGAYKASTGAYKYMLMRLFQVATGDDPEGDERTDQNVATASSWHNVAAAAPRITPSAIPDVAVGGRPAQASSYQIKQVKEASRDLKLGPIGMRDVIDEVLGERLAIDEMESEAQAQTLTNYLRDLSAVDIGKLAGSLRQRLEDDVVPVKGVAIDEG